MKSIEKYIATYFLKTKSILEKYNTNNIIKLQFFQRHNQALLGGMNEVLELLEKYTDISKYQIKYLPEGTIINAKEIVLELEGKYQYFGIMEGLIDGILSRSTTIATNAYECVQAAKGKPIIFMGDRMDHFLMQERDGDAIRLAGVNIMSTDAQNLPNSQLEPFGSYPHALIQNFNGDIKAVTKAYYEMFPQENVISLIDYHNDVIRDARLSYEAIGDKLWGVRVDTSASMKDHMFDNEEDNPKFYGVNVEQIKRLRKALDQMGANNVKITVSSGFTPAKIKEFEDNDTPVDFYGVGQFIFQPRCYFSADATVLNDQNQAKEGRQYQNNSRLIIYSK
ncbi:nicotinate phosphoribosyltransferase [Mycoplasmopsis synoviae]|uniref:nicotinate phosphoribosyltransferase n=1 Tax=Mycoplasmopsis synoviae TaxID=2109 RepID=A0AAX3F0C6_MYCSY|nr:nicotinate phosphoribosyltransferase [Mycoplasmopsis synoviae]QGL45042.1 nicotinate phosphoribosyltransferase [Mycoplasmopsis synoviae]QXV99741.1 nicotinate phosphoribosyltransferase [Mycoplasmopsis synoviae]UBM43933.1 nicotinate phosphoribosyltransferase [Mycoplasmopsis synoviae]UBX97294.1 nicotinate phosphoribosyltransferase [Mycoplasmopsis synoviae]UBX97983.1 nicotinate phosphoribosyltransferase [Mycoplasmopsis synoviae]